MDDRAKFVINIMLQKLGIKSKDIDTLINHFETANRSYKTIIDAMTRLQDHFIIERKYDEATICNILKDCSIYECSIDKIKTVEEIFEKRQYTFEEQKKVIGGYPSIFSYSADNIDKKVVYYNDIKIKNLMVNHSRHFIQGLDLTYARKHFLDTKMLFDERQKDLFLPEERFINIYGTEANNTKLKRRFPITESKYLIKK